MTKPIDLHQLEETLNQLSRDELITINRAIVKRIRILDDARRMMANAAFNRGDHVSWKDMDGEEHTGFVMRVNKKTISVQEVEDPDTIWRIPAPLLNKLSNY